MPSADISAGHGYLHGGVTQTFVPEGSGPLAILSELGFCNSSLSLITGCGNTKGSPVLQTCSFFFFFAIFFNIFIGV